MIGPIPALAPSEDVDVILQGADRYVASRHFPDPLGGGAGAAGRRRETAGLVVMVRILLAFLLTMSCGVVAGFLGAYDWPRLLMWAMFAPVLLAAGFIMAPVFVRRGQHRRAAR